MKLIIASLVVFSLVILFLFALFPADISVSRIVQIRCSPEKLRNKIADLREWKSWNELLGNALENKINAPVTTDSTEIRKGAFDVLLLKVLPDTVFTRWQYEKKSFRGNFNLTEMKGQVILEWTLHFHVKWYPWDKLSSMFYEKSLGPVMEKSMMNLRKELEGF